MLSPGNTNYSGTIPINYPNTTPTNYSNTIPTNYSNSTPTNYSTNYSNTTLTNYPGALPSNYDAVLTNYPSTTLTSYPITAPTSYADAPTSYPITNPNPMDLPSEGDVWLLKIPKPLNDLWKGSPGDQDLGYFLHNQATGEASLTLAGGTTISLPKEYNVVLTTHSNTEPPLVIFSQSKEKGAEIDRSVGRRGELTPVNGLSDEYRQLCKTRFEKSQVKNRVIKKLEDHSAGFIRPVNRITFPKAFQKKKEEDKRVRKPKDVVLDLIFNAFQKSPHLDLKSLLSHTDQPQAYLKEILQEVCIYNKRGPNRLMYELKDEYKIKPSS